MTQQPQQPRRQPRGKVYLLHFESKLGNRSGHYLGFAESENLADRLQEHRDCREAKILRVAVQRGIRFHLVRTWDDVTRGTERALKNLKDSRSLCPFCAEERREAKRFYLAMRKLGVTRRNRWNEHTRGKGRKARLKALLSPDRDDLEENSSNDKSNSFTGKERPALDRRQITDYGR